MLASEQDALYEVERAITRILEDRYGICEITGKPIKKSRLQAVPFTRYSLEGQQEVETASDEVVANEERMICLSKETKIPPECLLPTTQKSRPREAKG